MGGDEQLSVPPNVNPRPPLFVCSNNGHRQPGLAGSAFAERKSTATVVIPWLAQSTRTREKRTKGAAVPVTRISDVLASSESQFLNKQRLSFFPK